MKTLRKQYQDEVGISSRTHGFNGIHAAEGFSDDYVYWLENKIMREFINRPSNSNKASVAGPPAPAATINRFSEAYLALQAYYLENADKCSLSNFEAFCKQRLPVR